MRSGFGCGASTHGGRYDRPASSRDPLTGVDVFGCIRVVGSFGPYTNASIIDHAAVPERRARSTNDSIVSSRFVVPTAESERMEEVLVSTRGVWGFRIDGQDKIAYIAAEASPAYFGRRFVACLRAQPLDVLRALARRITVVPNVPNTSQAIWDQQADVVMLAQNPSPVIIDHADFLQDSLFCEWGYVADLDRERLDIYQGKNRRKHRQAPQYAITQAYDGYWACERLLDLDLATLPDPEAIEDIVRAARRNRTEREA
jgi:hypothetical protein